MDQLLQNIDPVAVNMILFLVAITVLDFVTGTLRAVANRTFQLAALDVWVRTQLLGRVVPVTLVIAFGALVGNVTIGDPNAGGIELSLVTSAGQLAALAAIAAGVKSIIDNLRPSVEHPVPEE